LPSRPSLKSSYAVVRFAEDSLFAPMAAVELRGDHTRGASVEDARKLHEEFKKETQE
jgi:hypothetical protein